MKYVAIEARCRPILDIGVGAGRTTQLLRAISRDYVGIDDSPAMVEMCRAAHPEAHIIFGANVDESLDEQIWVTVIATGYDAEGQEHARPAKDPASATGSWQIDRPRAAAPAFVSDDDLDVPAFLRNR